MKRTLSQDLTVVAAVCSWLLVTPVSIASADDHGRKGPQAKLEDTVNWWQWAFAIPSSVHPLSLKVETDPTGKNYCMVGQDGDVWYLGGIFKIIEAPPESTDTATLAESDEIEPFVVERKCRIPLGKEILIPVLNVECNTAEEVALGNLASDAALDDKLAYLRDGCAKPIADLITESTAQFGLEGKSPKEIKVKRLANKKPFKLTFSPDNIINPLGAIDFSNPDPNPSLAFADGYWAKVKPKKPGNYVLTTYGVLAAFDFALQITYELEVVEEGPGAIFD